MKTGCLDWGQKKSGRGGKVWMSPEFQVGGRGQRAGPRGDIINSVEHILKVWAWFYSLLPCHGKMWRCRLQKLKDHRPFDVHRSETNAYRKKKTLRKCIGGTREQGIWHVRSIGASGGLSGIFFKNRAGKAYSTQCSQVVAHLSTNWA